MDKTSAPNVSDSSNVVCEKEAQTGGTGLATTISFSGYTGATTRLADAGTGTISFDHQHGADGNVGSSRIWDSGGGMESHAAGATTGATTGATGDSVVGNRSLLDLSRKDDVKVPALGSFRGSRFKLNLLGRPRRVLRNDDSTGSDESVEVGENNNQADSKERVGTTSEYDGSVRKMEIIPSESLRNGVEEISIRKTESVRTSIEEISTRKAEASCRELVSADEVSSKANVSEQASVTTAENLVSDRVACEHRSRSASDSGAGTRTEVSSAADHAVSQCYQNAREVSVARQEPVSKPREAPEQAKGVDSQRPSAITTAESLPPQAHRLRLGTGEVSEVCASRPETGLRAESCALPRPLVDKVLSVKRVAFSTEDLVSRMSPLGERPELLSAVGFRREDGISRAKAPPQASLDNNAVEKSQYRDSGNEVQQRVYQKTPEAPRALAQSVEKSASADPRAAQESAERAVPGESKEADAARKVRENANFVWVNNKRYQKLGRIGSGGSSHVFKVIAQDCTIYALKRISLKGRDYHSACGFHQEIEYLERLKGRSHIIQLIDYEVTDKSIFSSGTAFEGNIQSDIRIYMVLEYGEIDLAHMLERKKNENGELDENWLRLYWEHILKAVYTIHEERIVHADLKPANFLLVQGTLKLIDFGIAKAIQNDTTNIVRESQVGTVNYMSPEAFMMNSNDDNGTVKCGRASDIWSLGCILYQMVHGRTPFHHLTFYQKITEITNPRHVINFPPVSNPLILDIMKSCLVWDKSKRPRIPQLLDHPFLRPRPPEDHLEDLREALLRACKSYVNIKGNVQLNELLRRLMKGTDPSPDQVDNVLIPFARLYVRKAGTSALRDLLTSVVL